MRLERCPNLNHGRSNPPIRCCIECGKVVNANFVVKKCSDDEHAKDRRNRYKYCGDCGVQLIT